MKKAIISILLIISAIISSCIFIACQEEITYDVVCTIFPQYDFCKNIVGEEISVKMLLPCGTDAHNYTLTTRDKRAIKNCKIFVYNGGESEQWVNDVIKSTDLSTTRIVNSSQAVNLLSSDGHSHDNDFDEHFYLSITNAKKICLDLYENLCVVFPDKKDIFTQNYQIYISKLDSLDTLYTQSLSEYKNETLYFADRFPFIYLTQEYGLAHYALFDGCSTDAGISVSDKINFEKAYQDSGKSGVFILENGNDEMAVAVTREYGGEIFVLNSCQTVSKAQLDEGTGYVEIMTTNLDEIIKGLK